MLTLLEKKDFDIPAALAAPSELMCNASTLTVHCQRAEQAAGCRKDHSILYAEAKKATSLNTMGFTPKVTWTGALG